MPIFQVLIVILFFVIFASAIVVVKQRSAVVIERFGKFHRIYKAGFNLRIPIIDVKAGLVNLKVRELPVDIETKTLDDVFVRMVVSVQYYVVESSEGIKTAFYKFDDPDRQIQSFVFDSIRSEVPKLNLDDVFSEKDKIATAVQLELAETMAEYGFTIVKTLVTDIDPDANVKHSMNEINAAKRMKEAAKEYAAADKIKVIAAAEAEAESKKLQGVGIAEQRIAIANGLKQSVEEVKGAMEKDVTGQQVMNMLFMTQHYDTISRLADQGVNTIFVPYSPGTVGDLQSQIQSGLLGTDAILKSTTKEDYQRKEEPEVVRSRKTNIEKNKPRESQNEISDFDFED